MIVKLIILILIAWFGYRVYQSSKAIAKHKPRENEIQDMVACKKCGIHLPASEALKKGDKYYCSKEHLEISD